MEPRNKRPTSSGKPHNSGFYLSLIKFVILLSVLLITDYGIKQYQSFLPLPLLLRGCTVSATMYSSVTAYAIISD